MPRADGMMIQLNDRHFVVEGNIDEDLVNIHPRKVNQGDPGPDDHPINSTWVQSDFTGGGQVLWGSPDVITGRFDMAEAETMQAKTITLPPLPDSWEDPASSGNDSFMLGTYNNKVYASWGSDIRYYNSGTDSWDNMASNLTSTPVGKGKVFVPRSGGLAGSSLFVIPLGSSIDYVNGGTITNIAETAVDVLVMDNKLWRLGQQGELEYTSDMTTWSGLTYVPDGSTPKKLDVFLTVGGDPTVYVTTSSSVFVWDATSGTLLQSQLQYPRHPDQGRASCVWRGELYTSVGTGLHRYNRSTISASGLDRDDGLPEAYTGVIVDLEPSYNCIYALLSSEPLFGTESTDPTILHTGDDYMVTVEPSVGTLLMKWNGFGWHFVDAINGGTAPSTVIVSDAEEDYGVWYATNKMVYRIRLNRTYMNLKDDIITNVKETGWFESSWYNFGWEGQDKVIKNLDIFLEVNSADEYVEVFYKLECNSSAWVKLGDAYGRESNFYFGPDVGAPSGSEDPNDYNGVICERIKLRFVLHRGSTLTNKPIIRWFTVVARKVLRPVRTFRLMLRLQKTNNYTPDQLRAFLIEHLKSPTAMEFCYQNERLKVDLVALAFKEKVEPTKVEYFARVNLIESFETIN